MLSTKPKSRTDPVRVLTTELTQRVFSLLDVKDLARTSQVCLKWNKSQSLNYGMSYSSPPFFRLTDLSFRRKSGSSRIVSLNLGIRHYLRVNGRVKNPKRTGYVILSVYPASNYSRRLSISARTTCVLHARSPSRIITLPPATDTLHHPPFHPATPRRAPFARRSGLPRRWKSLQTRLRCAGCTKSWVAGRHAGRPKLEWAVELVHAIVVDGTTLWIDRIWIDRHTGRGVDD